MPSAGELLMDLAEEVRAAGVPTGRGQIVSLNGRVVTPVVSVRDVEDCEADLEPLPPASDGEGLILSRAMHEWEMLYGAEA